jgi:hypothetical protein
MIRFRLVVSPRFTLLALRQRRERAAHFSVGFFPLQLQLLHLVLETVEPLPPLLRWFGLSRSCPEPVEEAHNSSNLAERYVQGEENPAEL